MARAGDVVADTLAMIGEELRPGISMLELDRIAEDHIRERGGVPTSKGYRGYPVGRAYHEDPQIPNFGAPGRGPELLPGMTVAIEPMINAGGPDVVMHADEWSISSADGSLSAHFEHTVAVTEDGPRVLTAAKRPVQAGLLP